MPANIEAWMALLIQVPFVGVFIYYSLKKDERAAQTQQSFMDALQKRDEAFERRNAALIDTINTMNAAICVELGKLREEQDDHDRFVRTKLERQTTAKR